MSRHFATPVRALAAATAALALAAAGAAQNATYSYFGTSATIGCSPFATQIAHTALDTPRLGTAFVAQVPASNGTCGYLCNLVFLATGFSNTAFQGVPLPYTPGPFSTNYNVCGSLRVSFERIDMAPIGATTGATAQLALTIPNAPNLVGLDFYQQAFSITWILGGVHTVALGRGGHGTIGY